MKNLICSIVFLIVYLLSVVLFYYLDFFKNKNCKLYGKNISNHSFPDNDVDWGKILGYAFIPSTIVMLVSWLICCKCLSKSKKYKYDFDSEFSYSCGMSDNSCSKYKYNDDGIWSRRNINPNSNMVKSKSGVFSGMNDSKYSCGMNY